MRKTILFRDGLIFSMITAVLFLGAVMREVNLLLFFASLLTSLLFLDRIFGKRSLKNLKIQRTLPTVIYVGDSFLVTLNLANERHRNISWAVLVEDCIVPDTSIYPEDLYRRKKGAIFRPACYFEEIGPGKTVRKTYAGQFPLRGRYTFRSLTISTRFPLGFFRSSRTMDDSLSILVFPRIGRLTPEWFHLYSLRSEEQNHSRHVMSRTSDELLGIRNWQSGDARKWIHWRASARHQKILVRQFEERQNQDVAVILDLYQAEALTTGDFVLAELAVSFSATLIREFTRLLSGDFHFAANGELNDEPPVISGKISLPFVRAMMERLAIIHTSEQDNLEKVLKDLFAKIRTSTNIILITTRPLDIYFSKRLDNLRNDLRWSRFLSRIEIIDTSSEQFGELFQTNSL